MYLPLDKKGFLRTWSRPYRRRLRLRALYLASRPARAASTAKFVAVTGSSGKSTATALISHILQGRSSVAEQLYSNTEVSISQAIRRLDRKTRFFVTETGIFNKGDMDGMARTIRPDIAVVTLIALEHKSVFRTVEAIAAEKGKLVEAVRPGGMAVLNADDDNVMAMAQRTGQRIVTFGRERDADYRVLSAVSRFPEPLRLKIAWRGNDIDIAVPLIGEHFWVSVAAAFATAVELDADPGEAAERLSCFKPLPRRCEQVRTDGGPVFLIDTVKSPLHSLHLVLKIMETASAPRKRIVFGQMSDNRNDRDYRDFYQAAREVCDQVIFVGERAHRSKASPEDRQAGRLVEIRGIEEACAYIRDTAIADEVILLKSSTRYHLDRIALVWKEDVRCWVEDCGKVDSCEECGLFDRPFSEHGGVPPRRGLKTAGIKQPS